MIELLRAAVNGGLSDRPAVVSAGATITYAELVERAEATARGLQARGIERFGALCADAIDAIVLLAGAALVGAEICLYAADAAPDAVADLAERFSHPVVVTDRTDLGDGPEVVSLGELVAAGAGHELHEVPPGTPRRLLVLTTGTTGRPRAAIQDWNRVLRPSERVPHGAEQRLLLAYGLHQFAGLQVLVHILRTAGTLVAPPSNQPKDALATIYEEQVDRVSATPTFWRFLLAELRAADREPPPLQQITLGGEAVPERLLSDVREAFPTAKVSQIYGATEFGMSGSVRDDRNGLPASLLDRPEEHDVRFKVEDGELWVRSRVGMLGYYGEEAGDPDGWRSTGDLVEVVGDRIEFRGRKAEIINVGGVKVHPLPIEERVSKLGGVQIVRAYGRANALTGNIVALEVVPQPGADTEALREEIRQACGDLPDASIPRSIRFVETVKIMGSKVVRGSDPPPEA